MFLEIKQKEIKLEGEDFMASNRKVKRRLKKKALIALLFTLISLGIVFTAVIKAVSNNSVTDSKSDSKIVASNNSKEIEKINTSKSDKSEKTVIVIDPAFGGEYAGSKGFNGVLQKDVNLDIALNVKKTIDRYDDVEVYLTRDSDKTVSYENRIALIKEKKADIVVSIQQNTEGTGKAEGVETYVLNKSDYSKSDSSLGYTIQKAMNMYSKSTNRGVMTRNTDILKDSYKVGAVGAVVYTGFITNEKESKLLTTPSYTERLGEGIAQGILSYVDKINSSKK